MVGKHAPVECHTSKNVRESQLGLGALKIKRTQSWVNGGEDGSKKRWRKGEYDPHMYETLTEAIFFTEVIFFKQYNDIKSRLE